MAECTESRGVFPASPGGVNMLVAVVDGPRMPSDWLARAEAARPWVDVFILRVKERPAIEQWKLAVMLVQTVAPCPVLVADRADVAEAAHAAGVHLPATSLLPSQIRRIWPKAVVSRSVHGVDDIVEAESANWLIFGHIFATRSKPGVLPRGLEEAGRVKQAAAVPVIGIGGVTVANAGRVREAGLDGIAVVDAIWQALRSDTAAQDLRQAFLAGEGGRT